MRSKVAQWWSTRLLTDRLWVRAPPLEPIFFRKIHGLLNSWFAKRCRGVEQLVARRAHNPEAAGSSPVPATNVKIANGDFSAFSGDKLEPVGVGVREKVRWTFEPHTVRRRLVGSQGRSVVTRTQVLSPQPM